MVEKGAAKFELASLDGKRRAAAFFAELLAAVEDPVVRDATTARAAAAIGVPAPTVARLVEAQRSRPRRGPPAERADAPAAAPPARRSLAATPARRKAVRDLIDVCLNRPALIEERHVRRLPDLLVEESEAVRDLVLGLARRAWIDPEGTPAAIMSIVEDETFRALLGSLLRDSEETKDLRPQLEGALRYLENGMLERQIHTLADTVMLTGSDEALRLLSETRMRAEEIRRRGRADGGEAGEA
jgi:hypothetical protein